MKEANQQHILDQSFWKLTVVSPCETHHLADNKPLYDCRFESVLKFHDPGYAPVTDSTGSYHIDIFGRPLYAFRYVRTFGFYERLAAVESEIGWFHILPNGHAAYEETYAWCGNFQEGLCPLRDKAGDYFHINTDGKRPYRQAYSYVGDFKDGIAVVCREDGKSTHIDRYGNYIHAHWYPQLDIFHKGFARAKDERGWFHVNKDGIPAYSQRFANLEPFYNGQAHAVDSEGSVLIIDEQGQTIKEIFKTTKNTIGELSGDLVGFWKSETIKLAVELRLLDHLPGSLDELTNKLQLPTSNLEKILRALWEIGIVEKQHDFWTLTDKGKLLVPQEKSFMASASIMWSKVQEAWGSLKDKIKTKEIYHHPTFKEETIDQPSLEIYRRALKGYAEEDFREIAEEPCWKGHSIIVGVGQTAITLLTHIVKDHPTLKGILLNEDKPLYQVNIEETLKPRLQQVFTDIQKAWDIQADAVLLPRFLHYFPDKEALQILENVRRILPQNGKLYIFEMVLDPEQPNGSLLDLNMLAEAGGKLRTLSQWKSMLKNSGFHLKNFQILKPHLHLMVVTKV